MGAALDGVHGGEAGRETEGFELALEKFGDGADAGGIIGARVEVDEPFEEFDGGCGLFFHGGEDGGFGGGKGEILGREEGGEEDG